MACPHLERCSGCPAMHLAYPEQLSRKLERLRLAFARYPELASVVITSVEPAEPSLAYRTRVKWMVGAEGELGLFARGGGHLVVDIPGCVVVDPAILEVGRTLRHLLTTEGPARRLRAVDIRVARSSGAPARLLLTLVSERLALQHGEALDLAQRIARRCPAVAGIAWTETLPGAVQVLGARTVPLVGRGAVPDVVGSATVTATFGAFVQAHRGQAARIEGALLDAARALGPSPQVLELFSGSGAFAMALAAAGAEVDAVESHVPAAVELEHRGADGIRSHAADAEAFTAAAAKEGRSWDLIVVDPPRRGLTPRLREAIAALAPRVVAYVSCDPETLARDLAHFDRLGLGATNVRGLDMIPQTDEVEAIALLTPRPIPPPATRATFSAGSVVELGAHASGAGVALPPPARGSGLALALDRGASKPPARWSAVALVKGVVHKRGALRGRARYVRLLIASGHSLVRIEGATPAQAASDLAAIGHPVLGDERRCDAPTLRHFFDKHGLDRPFWHTDELAVEGAAAVRARLPGDLVRVLAGLGAELPDGGQEG